jgi:integrase
VREGNLLVIQRDKRARCDRAGPTAVTYYWKEVTPEAQTKVREFEELARAQGQTLLFEGLSAAAYRADFKQAKNSAGISPNLEIVPHSLRHGFVSRMTESAYPPAIQVLCEMSRGTAMRYSLPLESREVEAKARIAAAARHKPVAGKRTAVREK